jgi:hypothetical protein
MLDAAARAENLTRACARGPLQHLAALIGAFLGRTKGVEQDADHAEFCRRLLRGLGYDPETHIVARKNGGLVIRDHRGEACEWLSAKKLRALMADADFLGAFA